MSYEQLSGPELEFIQRWRELVDRGGGDGGQKRIAGRLKWSTSTVSRDYAGITLPSDDRLEELSAHLRLTNAQRIELAVLLRQARDARQARRRASVAAAQAGTLIPEPLGPTRVRRRRGRLVAAVAVAAAVVTAGVVAWHPWDGGAQSGVVGSFPGEGLKAVPIPVKSLSTSLAGAFGHGRTASAVTVTGYEFRNAGNQSLCLSARDTGPTAGKDHDPVEITTCKLAANQIWIPEQWEVNGSTFSHLVSYEYQSMCLNAKHNGGLHDGQPTMLWDCYYPANNESWDFGDWYLNVKPGVHSYPLLLHTSRLCLDADKFGGFADGDAVNIWTQYAAANQFWS